MVKAAFVFAYFRLFEMRLMDESNNTGLKYPTLNTLIIKTNHMLFIPMKLQDAKSTNQIVLSF